MSLFVDINNASIIQMSSDKMSVVFKWGIAQTMDQCVYHVIKPGF